VILVDSNLLIYAIQADSPRHEQARDWLEGRLNGPSRVGLPWASLLAFMRVATNARLHPRPIAVSEAWAVVRAWLGLRSVWVPEPTWRHADVLEPLLGEVVRPALLTDAHLAALAIEHGLTLCSMDGDFARFPGLRWENPLAG
jgi:toxin-antitoxin system PIN domain toxin